MIVTKLLPVTKGRSKVYIDEMYYFALYSKEISQYKIKEGQPVQQELVDHILCEVILKRAKLRAMHLLEKQERTIADVRNKLATSYYREDIIDQVISFLEEYHYVDDLRYCRQYIAYKKMAYSMRQIQYKLLEKGSAKDIIMCALEEDKDEGEEWQLLEKTLEKKLRGKDTTDWQRSDWNKIYQFLMRKGFASGDVMRVINNWQEKEEK